MKGTGAKGNVCPSSCVSTGAKFPVAPVESAPMGPGEITNNRYQQLIFSDLKSKQTEQKTSHLTCTDVHCSQWYAKQW